MESRLLMNINRYGLFGITLTPPNTNNRYHIICCHYFPYNKVALEEEVTSYHQDYEVEGGGRKSEVQG